MLERYLSAIVAQKGVGDLRHLQTRTLWVEDQVKRSTNTADVVTKYLSVQTMTNVLRRLPVAFEHERSSMAAQLQGRATA